MTNPSNRIVPPDAIILAELRANRSLKEIAARHGIRPGTLKGHASRHKLLQQAEAADAGITRLNETAEKIVRKRNAILPGRDLTIVEILISLPRIPTLHGRFQEA